MAPRLALSQLELIRDMMISGEPFTASQIAEAAGYSEQSIKISALIYGCLAGSEHLRIVSVADEASHQ